MRCLVCQGRHSRVCKKRSHTDPDNLEEYPRRRRICLNPKCRHRFTTFEVFETPDLDASVQLAAIREILEGVAPASRTRSRRLHT